MEYTIQTTVAGEFDDVVSATNVALSDGGFGVLRDIDIQATPKEKLGEEFRQYRIFGACLQQFITYKAERAGIRVEKVDTYHTSQRCSASGSMGTRDGNHVSCSECDRGRHADLSASENISQREGEPCTG